MNSLEEARRIINEVDEKMAELFCARMRAVETVCAYKMEHGLPILDEAREAEVIRRNSERVDDEVLREYYVQFLTGNMALSRAYQDRMMHGRPVDGSDSYYRPAMPTGLCNDIK